MTARAVTSAEIAAPGRCPGLARSCRGGRALVAGAAVVAAALHVGAASAQDAISASALASAPVRIGMRSAVEVERSEVTLGDVAALTSPDAHLMRRLAAVPLGQAPRAGDSVRVERDDLVRWIRARTGIDSARITWSGAKSVEVRRAMQNVAGDAIAQRAAERLRSALERDGLRVELTPSPQPRGMIVPAGPIDIEVRPVPRDAVLSRRLTVWVEVWVDGSFVRAVPVGFDMRVFGPAYVATEMLPVGHLLAPSSLTVREVVWSGRTALPIDSQGAVDGLRLRRPLAAGDTVTRAHVEAAPLVARGDWATLRASQGVVALESRVEVLQDGMSGQSVRVKLPHASSAILARVTGRGTVEVRE